eukprot:TRINITY_DN2229_c0_g1_i2.p1 TRINITY_DN2229_c0_g1~~TRINITY_DN2229_c0_g1_i2.p1  ORF type:complete len:319 (+),score=39.83 TRINITY_DN2229_c0_g1_i2:121-1077(+)
MSNPAMEYRRLGRSGLFVSALGLGAWMTEDLLPDEETAVQVVKAALDGGCNFIDTAERYANGKSDILVGKVLKRLAVKRSDLVITTKIFWGNPGGPNDVGLSRKHIIEGTDAALQRLQLDYVDIIFAHRFDHETPLEETVRAFNHVINQGKAFYWGTSEWSARAIQEAQSIADRLGLIGPIVEQPQYNMFHRTRFEKEYAPLYSSIGLGTTIWSPLAGGILSGKYTSTKLEEAPEVTPPSFLCTKFLPRDLFCSSATSASASGIFRFRLTHLVILFLNFLSWNHVRVASNTLPGVAPQGLRNVQELHGIWPGNRDWRC